MLFNTVEVAATLTVGVDAFRNDRKRTSSRPRVITGISIVGGASIGEATIDLFVENYLVGSFQNSKSGVVAHQMPDDFQAIGRRAVPAGSPVVAQVAVAPTTNPLKIQVYGDEL